MGQDPAVGTRVREGVLQRGGGGFGITLNVSLAFLHWIAINFMLPALIAWVI